MDFVRSSPLLVRALPIVLVSALFAACGAQGAQALVVPLAPVVNAPLVGNDAAPVPPTPTPTPEPLVLPAGTEVRPMMEGTPYETTLYIIGSGVAGPCGLV